MGTGITLSDRFKALKILKAPSLGEDSEESVAALHHLFGTLEVTFDGSQKCEEETGKTKQPKTTCLHKLFSRKATSKKKSKPNALQNVTNKSKEKKGEKEHAPQKTSKSVSKHDKTKQKEKSRQVEVNSETSLSSDSLVKATIPAEASQQNGSSVGHVQAAVISETPKQTALSTEAIPPKNVQKSACSTGRPRDPRLIFGSRPYGVAKAAAKATSDVCDSLKAQENVEKDTKKVDVAATEDQNKAEDAHTGDGCSSSKVTEDLNFKLSNYDETCMDSDVLNESSTEEMKVQNVSSTSNGKTDQNANVVADLSKTDEGKENRTLAKDGKATSVKKNDSKVCSKAVTAAVDHDSQKQAKNVAVFPSKAYKVKEKSRKIAGAEYEAAHTDSAGVNDKNVKQKDNQKLERKLKGKLENLPGVRIRGKNEQSGARTKTAPVPKVVEKVDKPLTGILKKKSGNIDSVKEKTEMTKDNDKCAIESCTEKPSGPLKGILKKSSAVQQKQMTKNNDKCHPKPCPAKQSNVKSSTEKLSKVDPSSGMISKQKVCAEKPSNILLNKDLNSSSKQGKGILKCKKKPTMHTKDEGKTSDTTKGEKRKEMSGKSEDISPNGAKRVAPIVVKLAITPSPDNKQLNVRVVSTEEDGDGPCSLSDRVQISLEGNSKHDEHCPEKTSETSTELQTIQSAGEDGLDKGSPIKVHIGSGRGKTMDGNMSLVQPPLRREISVVVGGTFSGSSPVVEGPLEVQNPSGGVTSVNRDVPLMQNPSIVSNTANSVSVSSVSTSKQTIPAEYGVYSSMSVVEVPNPSGGLTAADVALPSHITLQSPGPSGVLSTANGVPVSNMQSTSKQTIHAEYGVFSSRPDEVETAQTLSGVHMNVSGEGKEMLSNDDNTSQTKEHMESRENRIHCIAESTDESKTECTEDNISKSECGVGYNTHECGRKNEQVSNRVTTYCGKKTRPITVCVHESKQKPSASFRMREAAIKPHHRVLIELPRHGVMQESDNLDIVDMDMSSSSNSDMEMSSEQEIGGICFVDKSSEAAETKQILHGLKPQLNDGTVCETNSNNLKNDSPHDKEDSLQTVSVIKANVPENVQIEASGLLKTLQQAKQIVNTTSISSNEKTRDQITSSNVPVFSTNAVIVCENAAKSALTSSNSSMFDKVEETPVSTSASLVDANTLTPRDTTYVVHSNRSSESCTSTSDISHLDSTIPYGSDKDDTMPYGSSEESSNHTIHTSHGNAESCVMVCEKDEGLQGIVVPERNVNQKLLLEEHGDTVEGKSQEQKWSELKEDVSLSSTTQMTVDCMANQDDTEAKKRLEKDSVKEVFHQTMIPEEERCRKSAQNSNPHSTPPHPSTPGTPVIDENDNFLGGDNKTLHSPERHMQECPLKLPYIMLTPDDRTSRATGVSLGATRSAQQLRKGSADQKCMLPDHQKEERRLRLEPIAHRDTARPIYMRELSNISDISLGEEEERRLNARQNQEPLEPLVVKGTDYKDIPYEPEFDQAPSRRHSYDGGDTPYERTVSDHNREHASHSLESQVTSGRDYAGHHKKNACGRRRDERYDHSGRQCFSDNDDLPEPRSRWRVDDNWRDGRQADFVTSDRMAVTQDSYRDGYRSSDNSPRPRLRQSVSPDWTGDDSLRREQQADSSNSDPMIIGQYSVRKRYRSPDDSPRRPRARRSMSPCWRDSQHSQLIDSTNADRTTVSHDTCRYDDLNDVNSVPVLRGRSPDWRDYENQHRKPPNLMYPDRMSDVNASARSSFNFKDDHQVPGSRPSASPGWRNENTGFEHQAELRKSDPITNSGVGGYNFADGQPSPRYRESASPKWREKQRSGQQPNMINSDQMTAVQTLRLQINTAVNPAHRAALELALKALMPLEMTFPKDNTCIEVNSDFVPERKSRLSADKQFVNRAFEQSFEMDDGRENAELENGRKTRVHDDSHITSTGYAAEDNHNIKESSTCYGNNFQCEKNSDHPTDPRLEKFTINREHGGYESLTYTIKNDRYQGRENNPPVEQVANQQETDHVATSNCQSRSASPRERDEHKKSESKKTKRKTKRFHGRPLIKDKSSTDPCPIPLQNEDDVSSTADPRRSVTPEPQVNKELKPLKWKSSKHKRRAKESRKTGNHKDKDKQKHKKQQDRITSSDVIPQDADPSRQLREVKSSENVQSASESKEESRRNTMTHPIAPKHDVPNDDQTQCLTSPPDKDKCEPDNTKVQQTIDAFVKEARRTSSCANNCAEESTSQREEGHSRVSNKSTPKISGSPKESKHQSYRDQNVHGIKSQSSPLKHARSQGNPRSKEKTRSRTPEHHRRHSYDRRRENRTISRRRSRSVESSDDPSEPPKKITRQGHFSRFFRGNWRGVKFGPFRHFHGMQRGNRFSKYTTRNSVYPGSLGKPYGSQTFMRGRGRGRYRGSGFQPAYWKRDRFRYAKKHGQDSPSLSMKELGFRSLVPWEDVQDTVSDIKSKMADVENSSKDVKKSVASKQIPKILKSKEDVESALTCIHNKMYDMSSEDRCEMSLHRQKYEVLMADIRIHTEVLAKRLTKDEQKKTVSRFVNNVTGIPNVHTTVELKILTWLRQQEFLTMLPACKDLLVNKMHALRKGKLSINTDESDCPLSDGSNDRSPDTTQPDDVETSPVILSCPELGVSTPETLMPDSCQKSWSETRHVSTFHEVNKPDEMHSDLFKTPPQPQRKLVSSTEGESDHADGSLVNTSNVRMVFCKLDTLPSDVEMVEATEDIPRKNEIPSSSISDSTSQHKPITSKSVTSSGSLKDINDLCQPSSILLNASSGCSVQSCIKVAESFPSQISSRAILANDYVTRVQRLASQSRMSSESGTDVQTSMLKDQQRKAKKRHKSHKSPGRSSDSASQSEQSTGKATSKSPRSKVDQWQQWKASGSKPVKRKSCSSLDAMYEDYDKSCTDAQDSKIEDTKGVNNVSSVASLETGVSP